MSSHNEECKVNMVRILESDKSSAITYREKVTICILFDSQRPITYLRIRNNDQSVFTQELDTLEWIRESSINGVTTIRSPKTTVVIIYDPENESLVDFFAKLQKSLTHGPSRTASLNAVSSQLNEVQLQLMTDDLVKSINSGDSTEAELITQELAKSRAYIEFILISKNDNQEKETSQLNLNTHVVESSDSVLQLSLRIECSLNKDPIVARIMVRSGTTLQSLKQQIEKETNIRSADQYWFAFERYLISDEYIFGSLGPFVSNRNQQVSSGNPIRSGDMLIIYIAQTSPYH